MWFILTRILPVLFVSLLMQEAHRWCFAHHTWQLYIGACLWHCGWRAHMLGDLHVLTSHRNKWLHGNVLMSLSESVSVCTMCKLHCLRLLWIARVDCPWSVADGKKRCSTASPIAHSFLLRTSPCQWQEPRATPLPFTCLHSSKELCRSLILTADLIMKCSH